MAEAKRPAIARIWRGRTRFEPGLLHMDEYGAGDPLPIEGRD
jgi:hypothetical protein